MLKSIFQGWGFVLLVFLFLSGCEYSIDYGETPSESFADMQVTDSFSFKTVENHTLSVSDYSPVAKAYDIYYRANGQEQYAGRFATDQLAELTLPQTADSIHIVPVNALSTGSGMARISTSDQVQVVSGPTIEEIYSGLYSIGSWDSDGVPFYLEPDRDIIEQSLLDDIAVSLPESRPVPQYNPDYLDGVAMNTLLDDLADVWITFVHEGAGWKNTLGYYIYDRSNPPTSSSEIDSIFVVFPNVSYTNSSGNLTSGDKVYLGRLPAGTGIGWVLLPDAWDSKKSTIKRKIDELKFSDPSFNTYTNADVSQHVILLNDENRELLLLGFEDTTRPGGDNDFNDAIFYVTANPYTAIDTTPFKEVQQAKDTDGDGLFDQIDEYPNDPERAYFAYYPAKGKQASMLFEDLWPELGDYDFNDLVVDYGLTFIKSADGDIKEVELRYSLKAAGGFFNNGLAWNIPIPSENIESVTYDNKPTLFGFKTEAAGAEFNETHSVIPVFANAHELFNTDKKIVNVVEGEPSLPTVGRMISVTFKTPVKSVGSAPFDLFITANRTRGHEIHLPGMAPTIQANQSLFKTKEDRSELGTPYTYRSEKGLPWALHVPFAIPHMQENEDFIKGYLLFRSWVESEGKVAVDWYENRNGFRNSSLLYSK